MISPGTKSPPLEAFRAPSPRARRIWALLLRTVYLLRESWPRLVEMLYWPAINLLCWGFLNTYLARPTTGTLGVAAGILIGGAIMWEGLVRTQFGVIMPFMEEVWSRNVGSLFVAPVPPVDYMLGLMILGLLRSIISIIPCLILARYLFDYTLPDMGWRIILLWVNLVMTGWWVGMLLVALLLRHGLAAEWLIWMALWLMAPIVAVYYPVEILPTWLQTVSWLLPPTYIFEGLRTLAAHEPLSALMMAKAVGLNILYIAGGLAVYLGTFNRARRGNGLLQLSE